MHIPVPFFAFFKIGFHITFNTFPFISQLSDMLMPGKTQFYKKKMCSTQLSMTFILLINVKMPTIVGILTFISMINTTSKSFKARKVIIFQHFSFSECLKFLARLS